MVGVRARGPADGPRGRLDPDPPAARSLLWLAAKPPAIRSGKTVEMRVARTGPHVRWWPNTSSERSGHPWASLLHSPEPPRTSMTSRRERCGGSAAGAARS